jgi:acyl-coenzyme A synthetase/AMP-(fatty) acid ligase
VNFAEDVLQSQPPERLALVELARDGSRREWTFGDVERGSARTASALVAHGIGRGGVVMTLIGNRPEWVLTMMACFRIGAVVLPCTEQLRAKDLRLRLAVAQPELVVADSRNRAELQGAQPDCTVLWTPSEAVGGRQGAGSGCHEMGGPARAREESPLSRARAQVTPQTDTQTPPSDDPLQPETSPGQPIRHDDPATVSSEPPPYADLQEDDPALITFTSEPPSYADLQEDDPALITFTSEPPSYADLQEDDPALITFTSGTAGEPKAVVHGQRYLCGQRVQAEDWLGAEAGDLVWCTAASGWSKSARNVFIAPWLMGASALVHDARFEPQERLDLIERERVQVLCMAPTEYRVIAKRAKLRSLPSLKGMVAAGEALNPEVLKVWRDATGLDIRDGYGQTETGQMTGMGIGVQARAGSMGKALRGTRLQVIEGELVADPRSVPTFFLGYLGDGITREEDGTWSIEDRREQGLWQTGDQVSEDEDGYLHFEGRSDDVIISAGYRIGPFEVESALVAHQAVAEAAAVSAPDEERGAVVRAIVVLSEGYEPSAKLASELQEHVKGETAPYKYPRIVEFAQDLPKTASGKIKRAELRDR